MDSSSHESANPHRQGSEPNLPRRDSLEDSDSTLTRKRPRLDSGSSGVDKAMSDEVGAGASVNTEPPSTPTKQNAQDAKPPPPSTPSRHPSQVTINIKNPAISSPAHDFSILIPEPVMGSPDSLKLEICAPGGMTEPPASLPSPPLEKAPEPAGGSPSVPLEIVSDSDAAEKDVKEQLILVEEDSVDDVDRYWNQFPYYDGSDLTKSLTNVAEHILDESSSVNTGVIHELAKWLDDMPSGPSVAEQLFYLELEFWDMMAVFIWKLFARRTEFADDKCSWETEQNAVPVLLRSYMRTVARLIETDVKSIESDAFVRDKMKILSTKHFKCLNQIFNGYQDTNMFRVLGQSYKVKVTEMAVSIAVDFCAPGINGMLHLSKFVRVGWDLVTPYVMKACLNCIDSLAGHHQELAPAAVLGHIDAVARYTLDAFRALDIQLQQVGKIVPVDFNRDCVIIAGRLLEAVARMEPRAAPDLAAEHLGLVAEEHDAKYLPALTAVAWKFKIYLKYVIKGRMELRVGCVNSLDTLLVEIFTQYNGSEQGYSHPVMQYLAHLLRDEKVVDYILGEDSHPQIISRSANIIGFLVVTKCYKQEDTDKIWNRISLSPDPRVVAAIFSMIKNIIHLMEAEQLCYLCEKFQTLPTSFYTTESFDLFREVTRTCSQQKGKDILTANMMLKPYRLCVGIIENTFPRINRPLGMEQSFYNEAYEQLKIWGKLLPASERSAIPESYIESIKERPEDATGRIHSLCLQLRLGIVQDVKELTDRADFANRVVEELCSFVQEERTQDSRPPRILAMTCRLDLLTWILSNVPESLNNSLSDALWDHLIGRAAANSHFRDLAWRKFCEIAQVRPSGNIYLNRVLELYIPSLPPVFFTAGLYEFVSEITESQMRRAVASGTLDVSPMQIPGATVLWKLILTAPEKTIEQQAAQLLASRYLEASIHLDTTSTGSDDLHVNLAQQCVTKLLESYSKLYPNPPSQNEMDTSEDSDRYIQELCFERTLLFMGIFLQSIRSRTDIRKKPRQDSKISQLPSKDIKGEPISIRFQAYDGGAGAIEQLAMGSENTLADLKESISRRTGFGKFTAYTGGAPLKLNDLPEQKIKDTRFVGWVLIKRDPNEASSESEVAQEGLNSVFGEEVEKSFDKIFGFLESSHRISAATYQFLTYLPISGGIASAIVKEGVTASDIFPLRHPYKVKYGCTALQHKLQSQLNKGVANEKFIKCVVQFLASVLCDDTLEQASLDNDDDFDLISMLVNTLVIFLKERPSQDTSTSYFSGTAALVDRMMMFIYKAAGHSRGESILHKCYATIVEGSLHSEQLWLEFTKREDVQSLHQRVLLNESRPSARVLIAKCIEGVCGDIQSSTSLSSSTIISFYWNLLHSIIPVCRDFPNQCRQMLELSDFVFNRYFEISKDEENLKECLQSWGGILLRHRHFEFVGRDDVDEVVLGFTKLLLSCVQFLKSFKKPLLAGDLMEAVFKKFLFLPTPDDLTLDDPDESVLPILESSTRKELYDLVLALSEDLPTHKKLMMLTYDLTVDEAVTATRGFGYDRAEEIRSSTGYVGINNPRNICYLNSLLTQFFMNLKFREFMLGLDIKESTAGQRLLVETKRLFANMQDSFRRATDPRDFAETVRSIDGNPIDISIQMDADEFCNLLLDQWEGQILSENAKKYFRSFYGGQTVNQIKSYECEHVSERVESFSVIQCDVRGHQNLTNSLEAFVKGDVMEGDNKYKCESCGGKFVKALKRQCLKDLPDNLIFQLKRFEFDLTNMSRAKVDDYFSFPEQIDVSPYKIDHLNNPSEPRTPDLFNLVGVLIHSGTAEGGHYYSFIRERPITTSTSSGWLNFNDRDVTELDPNDIPAFSFGGFTEDSAYQTSRVRLYNAYMLFYQRTSAMDAEKKALETTRTLVPPKVDVPEDLRIDISADNEVLLRDHCLFDPGHALFVRRLMNNQRKLNNNICSESHEQEKIATTVCLQHYHEVSCRVRENNDYEVLLRILRNVASNCTNCCKDVISYLVRTNNTMTDLLLKCPNSNIRTATRTFLLESLHQIRENDPVAYGVDVSDNDRCFVYDDTGALCTITAHLDSILQWSIDLNLKAWNDFFETLCIIANWGPSEGICFLQNDMLYRCLQILSCHVQENSKKQYPTLSRIIDRRKWLYNKMIEFVYRCLSRIDLTLQPTLTLEDRLEMADPVTQLAPVTVKEKQLLKAWHTEERCLMVLGRACDIWDPRGETAFIPGDILAMMVRAEPECGLLNEIFDTVYQGIKELQPQFAEPYIKAAISFCDACEDHDLVQETIRCVAKTACQLQNQVGGEVHLRFFSELLSKRMSANPEDGCEWLYCYRSLMETSSLWGMALVMYDDEFVRQKTAQFLEYLFFRIPTEREELADLTSMDGHEYLHLKFHVMRRMLNIMMKRIRTEHDENTSRNFMQPMIALCVQFVTTLQDLIQGNDEARDSLRDIPGDSALVTRFTSDIQPRLEMWQLDEDAALSGNEAMDGSDFESDSDAYAEDVNVS